MNVSKRNWIRCWRQSTRSANPVCHYPSERSEPDVVQSRFMIQCTNDDWCAHIRAHCVNQNSRPRFCVHVRWARKPSNVLRRGHEYWTNLLEQLPTPDDANYISGDYVLSRSG